MKGISILLITVALIAGMVGCGDGGGESYTLTISSTDGGNVTTPGEGILTYDRVTMVHLVAKAEEGYYFVNWTGDVDQITDVRAAVTTMLVNDSYFITASFVKYDPMVAAGGHHTVGLKSDGSVVAVGSNGDGRCDVGGWENIIQVAAGGRHTVGVKSDGTVVAVGRNDYGQCNVSDWTNSIRVAASWAHTVGLKSDGTLVAVGYNYSGQCNVGGWANIVQVAAGGYHTVGLKADGTAVAAGLEVELAKWNLG